MSFEVTQAFVEQYRDNVSMLVQQKGSRLRGSVMEESVQGQTAFFEQIGPTVAVKATTRHADTPLVSTPHARRQVSLSTYRWADLIDQADKVRMLVSLESPYSQNASNAMGRSTDDVLIAAATGDALTDGGAGTAPTTTPLPATQMVAQDFVEGGGSTPSGLTIGKLRETARIFGVNDVDEDEDRFMAVSQQQLNDLLTTTEVTSSDFNVVKALVEGKVDTFMGFKFLRTQRLVTANPSGGIIDRTCFAYVRSGIKLGMGRNPAGRIDELPGKNYSTQVFYAMDLGATRMEEEKVVEVTCREIFS